MYGQTEITDRSCMRNTESFIPDSLILGNVEDVIKVIRVQLRILFSKDIFMQMIISTCCCYVLDRYFPATLTQ